MTRYKAVRPDGTDFRTGPPMNEPWRPRRVWPFVVVAIALIVLVLLWEVAS